MGNCYSLFSDVVAVYDNIKKPATDTKSYRGIELANGLRAMLISDPRTEKSAAALSVGVGCTSDPIELPGLAHFCEHMLFLGTEKYPDEADYNQFLAENGGNYNAYTDTDFTLYFFDVAPDSFAPALDRFAQFFIAPLFDESCTEREVNAVNSENEKDKPDDTWRLFNVDQATMDPNHPYSKFTVGDINSLWNHPRAQGIDVRQALLDFHKKYYSANTMGLVVLGKESLNELQRMVESKFAPVVSKGVKLPEWADSPYSKPYLKLKIGIVPIKDLRIVTVQFPVNDYTNCCKCGALEYVLHLIGHEGPGSVLSFLKKKCWANALGSYNIGTGRGSSVVVVSIDLTEEGWKQQNQVLGIMFQYLRMLRAYGPRRWIWEEMRRINEFDFNYKDEENPISYVDVIAAALQDCPKLEDVLTNDYLFIKYRPDIIKEILLQLVPENCRILTQARSNETNATLTEKWYNVKYGVEKLDAALIREWKNTEIVPELAYPPPNEFIPFVFDLKQRDESSGNGIPRILIHNELLTGWFLQDTEFLLPKGSIQIELYSPLPLMSPLAYALNSAMVRFVEDELTEFGYMADLGKISYTISSSLYGVQIHLHGFDEKLAKLMNKVLEKIAEFQFNPDHFDHILDDMKRDCQNWEDEEPRTHAPYNLRNILLKRRWTTVDLLQGLQETTRDRLSDYAARFVTSLKINSLVYGNFSSDEAENLFNQIQQIFLLFGTRPLPSSVIVRSTEIRLTPGVELLYKSQTLVHSSSCTLVFFQAGQCNTHQTVMLELLTQICAETCFHKLRTQEQLGYVVHAWDLLFRNSGGFGIIVQSKFHPDYLEYRIDEYLKHQNDILRNMDEDEFLRFKESLHANLSNTPKSIEGKSGELWQEITSQQYNFHSRQEELKVLDAISHEVVLKFFEEVTGPSTRKRVVIKEVSMTPDGAGGQTGVEFPFPFTPSVKANVQSILDIPEWKAKQNTLFENSTPSILLPLPDPVPTISAPA